MEKEWMDGSNIEYNQLVVLSKTNITGIKMSKVLHSYFTKSAININRRVIKPLQLFLVTALTSEL